MTPDGRGLRNVKVTVSGGQISGIRTAVTSTFGYFSINGLRAGEVYVVSVGSRRLVFETPARVVSLSEDAMDVNFVGLPR